MLKAHIAIIPLTDARDIGWLGTHPLRELMPIAGYTPLERAISDAVEAGINEIVVVVGASEKRARAQIKCWENKQINAANKRAPSIRIEKRAKPSPIGTIVAELSMTRNPQSVAIILPNYVSSHSSFRLEKLLHAYGDNDLVFLTEPSLCQSTLNGSSSTGISDHFAPALVEHVGRYLLSPRAMKALGEQAAVAKSGADPLDQLLNSFGKVGKLIQLQTSGNVFNCNTEYGHLAASLAMALEDTEAKFELLQELNNTGVRNALINAADQRSKMDLVSAIEQAYALAGRR